jgi:hypothetical protein
MSEDNASYEFFQFAAVTTILIIISAEILEAIKDYNVLPNLKSWLDRKEKNNLEK